MPRERIDLKNYSNWNCPGCDSTGTTIGKSGDEWQEVSCEECGGYWIESYELVAVNFYKNKNEWLHETEGQVRKFLGDIKK